MQEITPKASPQLPATKRVLLAACAPVPTNRSRRHLGRGGVPLHDTTPGPETFRIMPAREIHAPHTLHEDVHFHIQRGLSAFGRNVSFEFRNSEVVLHGVVGSYYQKQMAQESLRRIKGLSRIDNRIQVVTR